MKEIKTVEAYPLAWPEGYVRTRFPKQSRFGGTSLYVSRELIRDEVRRFGGTDLIISTNIKTRADGEIYSNAKEPDDAGVAAYFKLKGKPVCFACDKWRKVWENTYAIAKTIDAMRATDRWGVSELLDRMFKGFLSLPAKIDDQWPVVLKISPDSDVETIKKAYRARAMENHPDRGGKQEDAAKINAAYDQAMKERGA